MGKQKQDLKGGKIKSLQRQVNKHFSSQTVVSVSAIKECSLVIGDFSHSSLWTKKVNVNLLLLQLVEQTN